MDGPCLALGGRFGNEAARVWLGECIRCLSVLHHERAAGCRLPAAVNRCVILYSVVWMLEFHGQ